MPPLQKTVGIVLVLLLLTTVVYGPVTHFDFVNFDDPHYVTGNEFVNTGLHWENVKRAFTGAHSANWHPLTWISHMIDCELFGLKAGGHHLTNLLWHLANTLLLFFLLRKLTGAVWRSGLVAALFALHPLHVESVAWISERKDVLSTFFGLLAMGSYARYATLPPETAGLKKRKTALYFATVVLFALGLLAKPMLVTWPLVFLLLDFWPLQRMSGNRADGFTGLLMEKIPFFVLSLLSSMITFVVQQEGGAVRSVSEYSLLFRGANAVVAYVRYLGKTFWPRDLAVFYPLPERWELGQIAGASVLLAVVSGAAWRWARSAPYFFTGWFWFLGTLIPVIGLVQVSEQAMADRYTYIPLIGIFIALAWGVPDLAQKHLHLSHRMLALVGSGVVLAGAGLTAKQVRYWKNTETLFAHAVAVTDKNYLALNHLSTDLLEQGRVREAEIYLTEAVKIRPQFFHAQLSLGNALAGQNRLSEAKAHFLAAAEITPDSWEAHYNLGQVWRAEGENERAAEAYTRALQLNPNHPEAHGGLALLLAGAGKMAAAVPHYAEVVRLQPAHAAARYNLATALFHLGRLREAEKEYQAALALQDDFLPAHVQLGRLLEQCGRRAEARNHWQMALRIQPDNAEAQQALAELSTGEK